jgi:glutathione S-transferase
VAKFYALSYSPWSEKARWALDHHRLQYSEREHVPLLGEGLLRWRARNADGNTASVPLLVDGDVSISDSYGIVRHADRVGQGSPLIVDPVCDEINELCDEGLRHARARVVLRVLASPKALDESSEAAAPAFATPLLRPVARYGADFLARKHGATLTTPEALDEQLGEVIAGLDQRLGHRNYMLDEFSAADICFAMLLQAVEPVGGGYISLKPATRECWRAPSLVARFAHLLEWRDALYAKHR